MEIAYRTNTDVLIIGMGAAGIKAAITAADAGVNVLMVGKCPFGTSGATFYPGTPGWGMQAVIHPGDTAEYFLEEILVAGAGAANVELAKLLAAQATDAFHELEDYGLEFGREPDGSYRGVIPCFGKRLRGSTTLGIPKIRQILWKQLMKRDVHIRDRVTVIALVKDTGAVVGAIAQDEQKQLCFIQAKSVVLATGGGCGIYKNSLATADETGDGYALALDAGASLVNMEFIQFIPGLTWPVKKVLFQEKNLDTLPDFTNYFGEDILAKYLPKHISKQNCLIERAKHGPFTTEDCSFWLDIAMYEEARKGNTTESGGIHVHYDTMIHQDKRFTITDWLKWMKTMGIDPAETGFDMIPHAQCFNGGIQIDAQANCGVPGLYAAGETAGGPHGADRLGGAAIAATQVFGKIAGKNAAAYAKEIVHCEVPEQVLKAALTSRFKAEGEPIDVDAAMSQIREIMWCNGALVRSHERCQAGLAQLAAIEESYSPMAQIAQDGDYRKASELTSYLTLAKALLSAMDAREESRGPHYRSDFPMRNSAFDGQIRINKKNEKTTTTIVKADLY